MNYRSTFIIYTVPVLMAMFAVKNTILAQTDAPPRNTGAFTVLSSTAEGLVVEYMPRLEPRELTVDGRRYRYFDGASASPGEAGMPPVLTESIIIARPPESGVEVRITSREVSEEEGIRLLPNPGIAEMDGIPTPVYIPDETAYASHEWSPGELAATGEEGMYRDYPVARIDFHPVRYLPAENRYQVVTRLVAEIRFLRSTTDARGMETLSGRSTDSFMRSAPGRTAGMERNVILNFGEAEAWKVRHAAMRRPANPIPQEGRWFSMPVTEEGIYRLTGQALSEAGIPVSGVNPAHIRMWNNNDLALPQNLDAPRPEGLLEIDIQVTGASDGRFDSQDAIIFYGRPASGWEYDSVDGRWNHYIHPYQDANIYFLQLDGGREGARMQSASPVTGLAAIQPAFFTARIFKEDEKLKLHESGLEWFADKFNNGDVREITVSLPGLAGAGAVDYALTFKGGAAGSHQFLVREGAQTLLTASFIAYTHSVYRATGAEGTSGAESRTLSFSYGGSRPESNAFLDWYEIAYPHRLQAVSDRLHVFGPDEDGIVEYPFTGFSTTPTALDVTDWRHPRIIPVSSAGGSVVLRDSAVAGAPRVYRLAAQAAMRTVTEMSPVTMTGLRARNVQADFIIITHDDFAAAIRPLEDMREERDSLSTEIVNISEIYNEFSGGLMDPAAIRDFLSFAYDNWRTASGEAPGYVLLVGDGDYDYRNVLNPNDKNWIPPYEIDSDNDLVTRCTDDWYVYLRGNDRMMDMAIGRLPVRSAEDVTVLMNKYRQYADGSTFGHWRSTFTLVADDELTPETSVERIHTDQSETLARASYVPGILNQKKVYLMEYPGERSVNETGLRKPQAETDFVAQLNRGTALASFIGHGNHTVLAHERVLNRDRDFNLIQNGERYFFFYPATCAFGRYDLPLTQTFAEELLTVPERGAIGMITSARDVFARQNFSLAQFVYEYLFSEAPTSRVGDALAAAKVRISENNINNEKFHLLCDPTLRIGLPKYRSEDISISPDSLPALGRITAEGTASRGGSAWDGFDGKVSLVAFDSDREGRHTMSNDDVVSYRLPGSAIFRGTNSASQSGGRFSLQFIVPKDITYGGENGRVSVYYWGDDDDGAGSLENIKSGGTANVENDQIGPEITIGFKDVGDFVPGTILEPDPVLNTTLSDMNGINITGEIGHKIELLIDEKAESRIDASEFFEYEEGSFTTGVLTYPLTGLAEGVHTLRVKAWDNFNNSSEAQVEFEIASQQDFTLADVFNYPNPFSRNTQFTFTISQPSFISIKIYSVAGRLLHSIDDLIAERAGQFASPLWDGSDVEGNKLANGVYFYKVIARNMSELHTESVQKIGKMVIMR